MFSDATNGLIDEAFVKRDQMREAMEASRDANAGQAKAAEEANAKRVALQEATKAAAEARTFALQAIEGELTPSMEAMIRRAEKSLPEPILTRPKR